MIDNQVRCPTCGMTVNHHWHLNRCIKWVCDICGYSFIEEDTDAGRRLGRGNEIFMDGDY